MVKIKIRSIMIDIPHTPYPAQIVTMSKIISCLQEGSSALIESPTGTGKTFSILCSVLAYLESPLCAKDEHGNPPKVYICSRTHKQIDQIIASLKKTIYKPRTTVLASRALLCINPVLRNVSDKNTACTDFLKKKSCEYFYKKDDLAEKTKHSILDVEEYRRKGKQCKGCPFYATRELEVNCSVAFAPYNYIIDPAIRKSMGIKLKGCIVIIDEAHNIEDFCRSAGSLSLESILIDVLINEMYKVQRHAIEDGLRSEIVFINCFMRLFKDYAESNSSFNINKRFKTHDSDILKENEENYSSNHQKYNVNPATNNSKKIKKEVSEIKINKTSKFQDVIKKGKDIIEFLASLNIRHEHILKLQKSYTVLAKADVISLNSLKIIESLIIILETIFFGNPEAYVFSLMKNKNDTYKIDFILLDPSVIFAPLARSAKSIILLSGTLTPFKGFSTELGFYFKHKVEAPHIIDKSNVFIGIIKKGHLNKDLIGKYTNLESLEYINQLIIIIKGIRQKVGKSGGTLVFVPSYAFQDNLITKMDNDKFVFQEPRNNSGFDMLLKGYKQAIDRKMSPVMVCVYRGRASEGMDFKDEFARAVVAVGIPYPSFKDLEVVSKREFNDKFKTISIREEEIIDNINDSKSDKKETEYKNNLNNMDLKNDNNSSNKELNNLLNTEKIRIRTNHTSRMTGSEWYETQTFRAVNQALGRVLRHKNDWGGVFLVDCRYSEKRISRMLPKWVNENLKIYEKCDECIDEFKWFVRKKNNEEIKSQIK